MRNGQRSRTRSSAPGMGDDGPYVFRGHQLCWALSTAIARDAGMWTDEGEWPEPSEVRDALLGCFTGLVSLSAGIPQPVADAP